MCQGNWAFDSGAAHCSLFRITELKGNKGLLLVSHTHGRIFRELKHETPVGTQEWATASVTHDSKGLAGNLASQA